MMIIIKEAYLRDILVLKFPPSGRQVCQPSRSAGELVSEYISPWGLQVGQRGSGGADKSNSLCTHVCTHTRTHTTTISLQT